jgi:serine/threonine-protein kinase RsbW
VNRESAETSKGKNFGLGEPVSLRLPSSSEYVLLARMMASRVGQLAGFGEEDIYDLKLAVTEAATNAVRHAAVESFDIEYRLVPGMVEVTVTDLGGGFDESELARSPDGEGGFGLMVIRTLVDEVVLDSSAGRGTRLKMTRRAQTTGRTLAD